METITTQILVNTGDSCPEVQEGLEVFTPQVDGAYVKWVTVDGAWERTHDGDYRRDAATGRFRKVPFVVFMNGYSPAEYRRWLVREGFAA